MSVDVNMFATFYTILHTRPLCLRFSLKVSICECSCVRNFVHDQYASTFCPLVVEQALIRDYKATLKNLCAK